MHSLIIENLYFHTIGPVNLSVAESESIGVTGPSGAGKTLFLRAIADMDEFTGRIFLNGIESVGMPGHEWRKKVGLLPSESSWWFDTVGEHFKPQNTPKERFESLGFGSDVFNWKISRMSSGERQRLALLRLLENHPDVLLLDEPTANLDNDNILRVEKIISDYQIQNKPAIIWVTHDAEQLKRVSTSCFLLKDGRLINHQEC